MFLSKKEAKNMHCEDQFRHYVCYTIYTVAEESNSSMRKIFREILNDV